MILWFHLYMFITIGKFGLIIFSVLPDFFYCLISSELNSHYGKLAAWIYICMQSSNLPMHLRLIFKMVNLRFTKAYVFCEFSFYISYLLARTIGLFMLFKKYFYRSHTEQASFKSYFRCRKSNGFKLDLNNPSFSNFTV